MNNPRKHPAILLIQSAAAGWAALAVPFATEVFIVPHGPHYAPEVGPVGTFTIFGAVFSVFYLADFLLLAVPVYFFLRTRQWHIHPGLWALCGAAMFVLSVPVWSVVGGHLSTSDIVYWAVFAAIAGSVSFYVLSRLTYALRDAT